MEKLNDLMNEHDLDFNDIVNIIEKNIYRKIKKNNIILNISKLKKEKNKINWQIKNIIIKKIIYFIKYIILIFNILDLHGTRMCH